MPRRNTGPRIRWIDKRKSFYIVWYEGGQERSRSTGTTDGRQAQGALEEFLRERRRAELPDRPGDPDKVAIADVLDLYGDGHGQHTAAPERIGYAIDALLTFWGDKPVAAITKQACRDYATARARAPATIRRELSTLRAALNYAVAEKRLSMAPAVLLPAKPLGKERWLTRPEAARLLNAARTGRSDVRLYLPLFVLIGLYTGARKEAILSLRWPQVDLAAGRIDFRDGEETTKRRARQPIARPLLTFLRLARRRGSDLGFVVHDKGARIKDIGGAWDGTLAPAGTRQYAQGAFGRACLRAGLTGVSPHTLRHTCGTWMAQAGVPLRQIGGWLGHSDSRTTELYAHHHPDFMEEARGSFDRKRTPGERAGIKSGAGTT